MTATERVNAGDSTVGSQRVAAQPGEVIDRSQTFSITFDGRAYPAHPGDTLASALAAGGVRVFSRSFKYHRPRGLLCCAGHCPNCLVQVTGPDGAAEPNVRACTRAAEPGLVVKHQNAWPSLDFDLMHLAELGSRFLPVGFYYKTFIHPRALWPVYEKILRRAAGLGSLNTTAQPAVPPGAQVGNDHAKQFRYADVVVAGGGPAGLSAALAAAQRGANVLLCDANPQLGGHLRFGDAPGLLAELRAAVSAQANLTVLTDCQVTGWYEDNWLAAQQQEHLIKIRARALVVATGAYEQPLVFDHNDLPGVMLAGAAQRLLKLYGVLPGRRVLIVTANDDGWAIAADLLAAGASLAAIVDERARAACASPLRDTLSGQAPVYWEHTLAAAHGSNWVTGGRVVPVSGEAAGQSLVCDLILISVAWAPAAELAYQAGAKLQFDEARGELRASDLPPGIFVAGRAAGTHPAPQQVAEGRLAGENAAAFVGHGPLADQAALLDLAGQKAAEPVRTSSRVEAPGQGRDKRMVCFCEDVTDKDIRASVAEGFNSLELLKRYSTVGMGPCQGKLCAVNSVHLCARANGWSVPETGLTTLRPPTAPVSLRALAGLPMEPVQVSPLHAWHTAHQARLTVAGAWLRPERYGDPLLEVRAVRQSVGLIDVSTLGKLRLTGPGVPALLDRLYVNQFQKLAVGRVRYGVMCNDEGVVLDDGVCAHTGPQEWYLTTTSSGAGAIFEWIQWWAQSGWGAGVHITDLTEVNAAINLAGPQSRTVLAQLTALDVSNEAFPYMHTRDAEVAGVPCRLMRIGFTGELSYEIHAPAGCAQRVWDALLDAGRPQGIQPFGLEAQRVLRLEKGHLIIGQDTDAVTDPLAADLAWLVKLEKPDFLGRRSLTRVSAEGPQQKLVGFTLASPPGGGAASLVPEEGLQIVSPGPDGRLTIIGWITSSRFSPTLNASIGLCWLPAALAAQPGAPFSIRLLNGAGLAEGRVHPGPFYDPDGLRLRM
ncbi:MAG: (2Fe-2S)-binding protein [Anaerolineales bacterium]|nr:(2Fe-2S)-binding protein [Anaerolineales bacterium]